MSAREWTAGELNRVHPLPEGWTWSVMLPGRFSKALVGPVAWRGASYVEVGVRGDLVVVNCSHDRADVPADVLIAVGLVSKGLDSLEAMARALDVEARNHREWGGPTTPTGRANTSGNMSESAAVADAFVFAATMLRRGKVEP